MLKSKEFLLIKSKTLEINSFENEQDLVFLGLWKIKRKVSIDLKNMAMAGGLKEIFLHELTSQSFYVGLLFPLKFLVMSNDCTLGLMVKMRRKKRKGYLELSYKYNMAH